MSRIERLSATVALVAILSGVAVMVWTASAIPPLVFARSMAPSLETAQSFPDLQRQIDRLERRLEAMDTANARLTIDAFSRLSAAEREMELNRRIIYGMVLPMIGQFIVTLLTLRRLNERSHNGPPRLVTPGKGDP